MTPARKTAPAYQSSEFPISHRSSAFPLSGILHSQTAHSCKHRNIRKISDNTQSLLDRNHPTPHESLSDCSSCSRLSPMIPWSLPYRRPSAESVFLVHSSHLHSWHAPLGGFLPFPPGRPFF